MREKSGLPGGGIKMEPAVRVELTTNGLQILYMNFIFSIFLAVLWPKNRICLAIVWKDSCFYTLKNHMLPTVIRRQ